MQNRYWRIVIAAVLGAVSTLPAQNTARLAAVNPAPAIDSLPHSASSPASPVSRGWLHRGAWSGWIGTAHHSPFSTRRGVPMYRDFYLVGFRGRWAIDAKRTGTVEYFIDLFPAAITTDNPDYPIRTGCPAGPYICRSIQAVPHTVYGFGLAPLGISARLFNVGPVRLSAEVSGGALLFNRPVPDPAATKFNFTASGGLTFEVNVSRNAALRLGYLFHHTSNGGTGRVNPGLNSHMLSIGFSHLQK